ncbi:uncharacterized protein V6R79_024700 [Siganus canaliculatus]
MATSPVKEFLVGYLMPEKCYEQLFVNFRFHVPCIQYVLFRVFGFWIFLDTLFAQLPQLLKVLWRGSAAGLSLPSTLLQLYAFSCPVVFAVASNFPLFAWGERLITLAQTAVIILLIFHYRGDTLKGLLLLLVYPAIMFLLGSYAAAAVASVIHASSVPALAASKGVQAAANYRNGHTGQLSTLSVLMSWTGSLSAMFVSLRGTGSSFESLSHMVSTCLSCVLLAQVLCCSSSSTTAKKKE